MIPSSSNLKDPGRKKPTDAYTSEQTADKIVNEEDQAVVSNSQPENAPDSADRDAADQGEENTRPDALTNSASIEDSSHHTEAATPELLEEERKEDAGINP